MAKFVLVHGGWHGGWCYARVARLLREAGHDVYTPTLSGLAERSHLASSPITLSTHIQDVCAVLHWEQLSDVILVGHSYGGTVITGVASREAEKLRRLVYLDAFVPQDGQSMQDLVPEARRARLFQTSRPTGAWIAPVSAADFNVNEADQAMVDRLCTPHPVGCFLEALQLSGAEQTVKRSYIWTTGYINTPFKSFHDRFLDDPSWHVTQIATGHDAMLDDPSGLAALLTSDEVLG
jgi:pimeloyl-ACP methyl ester carboxylesterase